MTLRDHVQSAMFTTTLSGVTPAFLPIISFQRRSNSFGFSLSKACISGSWGFKLHFFLGWPQIPGGGRKPHAAVTTSSPVLMDFLPAQTFPTLCIASPHLNSAACLVRELANGAFASLR